MVLIKPTRITFEPSPPLSFLDTQEETLTSVNCEINLELKPEYIFQTEPLSQLDVAVIIYIRDSSMFSFENGEFTKSMVFNDLIPDQENKILISSGVIKFKTLVPFDSLQGWPLRLKVTSYYNSQTPIRTRTKRKSWQIQKIDQA